ncbi:MAG: hypothetical protein AMJ94_06895 [Deltaproteobacteria bacterium SM23_61]|nr:MAG: hypothetical protein AMJ94_06895 [Deltaproteobacteria bacterium SM23_61]
MTQLMFRRVTLFLVFLAGLIVLSIWGTWVYTLPDPILLLMPGVLVLGFRAIYALLGEDDFQKPQGGCKETNGLLILISIIAWSFAFYWLFKKGTGEIVLFSVGKEVGQKDFTVPLFVPFFGFFGALLFVIDLFRSGVGRDIDPYREFALRLVLGPYVAIVIVAFTETFEFIKFSDAMGARIVLAFFSGFLVVLALQRLTEWGNEVLGNWRAEGRYEPTELARHFRLSREDDQKLKKMGLIFPNQLQNLQANQLNQLEAQSGLGPGILGELQKRLQREAAEELLGSMQDRLEKHKIRNILELALLPANKIAEIADKENLNGELLQKLHSKCIKLVESP